jgi:hypothetical protein
MKGAEPDPHEQIRYSRSSSQQSPEDPEVTGFYYLHEKTILISADKIIVRPELDCFRKALALYGSA